MEDGDKSFTAEELLNYERWQTTHGFHPTWHERTELLADFIPQDAKTVLEFGAGDCHLRGVLPKHIRYTPSDLVSRGPDTIVQDLNETPYSFLDRHYDAVVLSGVFEYIIPIGEFIAYLYEVTDTVACSYAGTASHTPSPDSTEGWVNRLIQQEFCDMFTDVGFVIQERSDWKGQKLYKFGKVK